MFKIQVIIKLSLYVLGPHGRTLPHFILGGLDLENIEFCEGKGLRFLKFLILGDLYTSLEKYFQ